MTGNEIVQLIALVASLVLVVSGFSARRLSARQGVRMALIWAGVFAIVILFIAIVIEA